MGEHQVHDTSDELRTRKFVRAMLDDIQALEKMIELGWIESDKKRIGVEQEMYIIDSAGFPASLSDRLLENIDDSNFSTELARFNLEANLEPTPIGGDFLRRMEKDLRSALLQAEQAASKLNTRIVLTGILPTLREAHVSLDNLTPEIRYRCLNDTCMAVRGDNFTLNIDGVDRFESSHDCAVIEGASTSFQCHLQVAPAEAASLYNLAQLITAPLLAIAANSPVLLNRRVWHETRVALFERTFEYRSNPQLARDFPTRVGFGESWVEDSIIEVFRENAMRHHVIMVRDPGESSLELVNAGQIPELQSLTLHNGTVWRWNRPCYGITDGKPHLRIENRALPAGPTIIDQVANVALFYGLMQVMQPEAAGIPRQMSFATAKSNFFAAAQHGLAARFTWLDGNHIGARKLLRHRLIPLAREGLSQLEVPAGDIDNYLGILEARAQNCRSGARWLLDSLADLPEDRRETVCRQAVEIVHKRQSGDLPVHQWELMSVSNKSAENQRKARVGDIMTRNLFTVRPEDLVDLATSMMEWKHVRHVPVESSDGELVGLLSTRQLLHLHERSRDQSPMAVAEIMQTDPLTISADAPLEDAFTQMLESEVGCLLVVNGNQLLGIITERDLLEAAVEFIA